MRAVGNGQLRLRTREKETHAVTQGVTPNLAKSGKTGPSAVTASSFHSLVYSHR